MVRTAIIAASALCLGFEPAAAQAFVFDGDTSRMCFEVIPADARFEWLPPRVVLTVRRITPDNAMAQESEWIESRFGLAELAPGYENWTAMVHPDSDHLTLRTRGSVGDASRLIGGLYLEGSTLVGTVPFAMIADGVPANTEAFRLARTSCP